MNKSILLIIASFIVSVRALSNCPENLKCPFKNGFCCEDQETCCPKSYKCDPARKHHCVSADAYIRFPLRRSKVEKV